MKQVPRLEEEKKIIKQSAVKKILLFGLLALIEKTYSLATSVCARA